MGVHLPYIRISVFFKRKEGITPEKFHNYWTGPHSILAQKLPGFKQAAKRYSQVHCLPSFQESSKHFGLPTLDFDGFADVWVEDAAGYAQVLNDPENAKALALDAENFMGTGAHIMIGYETLEIGEPVPNLPQTNFATI